VFFQDGSIIRSLTLWILSAAALAAPFGLLWNENSKYRRAFGVVLAIVASIPPPLGLIGWGNPLTAAGLFFPGFGWFGSVLMLDLYAEAALSIKLRRVLITLVLVVTPFLGVPAIGERLTVGGVAIQTVNTPFGRMASGSGDFDTQYEREQMVFQHINAKKRSGDFEGVDLVVLPETIIGRMNPTTLKRWERFFSYFAKKGTIFIAGGEIPTDSGMKYDNVMVSFEGEEKRQIAKQRVPVPVSMFLPFSKNGANAYMSSLGEISIMEVYGKKLGFLVCYEQFLTWPLLSLLSQKPDVIVAPANLWWCKGTSLPAIRSAALRLWTQM
jgi:apolipoprotein N-acyltransferase